MNPQRWAWTVLVYCYDEHGGFHDHVAPPPVGYNTRANPAHVFDSLGPRVAAVVVSPYVNAGSVCHELFDHTSALQMLAELFTPGTPYSADVEDRRRKGVKSVSTALGDAARADVPMSRPTPSWWRARSAVASGCAGRTGCRRRSSWPPRSSWLPIRSGPGGSTRDLPVEGRRQLRAEEGGRGGLTRRR